MIILLFSPFLRCDVYVALGQVLSLALSVTSLFAGACRHNSQLAIMDNRDIRRVVTWSNSDPSFVRPSLVPSEEYPAPSKGELQKDITPSQLPLIFATRPTSSPPPPQKKILCENLSA